MSNDVAEDCAKCGNFGLPCQCPPDVRRFRVYARDLMPGDLLVAEWVYPKGLDARNVPLGGKRKEVQGQVQFITTDVDGDIIVALVGQPEAVTYPKSRVFSVDREV